MIDSARQQTVTLKRRKRSSAIRWAGATTLALAATSATFAFAANTTVTIDSASNSQLGKQVVLDAQGRTLYTLSPETSKHLLCKSSECFKRWPPVTVSSRKTKLQAGPGVHGRLGILRRSKGMLQLTLGGRPLYRYARDHAKGDANGEGIESFGGTWHAVSASGTTTPAPSSTPPTAPTTPTTPTMPGYGY